MVVGAIVVFLAACIVGGGLTAVACRIAPRIGLADHPDGHRKLHQRATPLGGGLALIVTLVAVVGTADAVPALAAL